MKTTYRLAVLLLTGALTLGATSRLSAETPAEEELRAARAKIAQLEAALKKSTALSDRMLDENAMLLKGVKAEYEKSVQLLAKLKAALDSGDVAMKDQVAKVAFLERELLREKKKNDEFFAIWKESLVEADKHLKDKLALKKELAEQLKENVRLQINANNAIQAKVNAEIEMIALKERNIQVEREMRDLAKAITNLKRDPNDKGSTVITLTAPNPPKVAVEGKVVTVTDGLLEINIGSDAGLEKGHTLEVFRIQPKGQYLGMMRVVSVEKNRAVGQIFGKSTAPVHKGDIVASKIGGN